MFGIFVFLLVCVSPCICESGNSGRRIYHGFETSIQNYPHAVFLHFEMTRPSSCGSSLLTAQAVLTAAHCVDEVRHERGSISAYMGHSTPMSANVLRVVVGYRVHPKYDEMNGRNNLAVAFFNSRVPLSAGIKKIPLTNRVPNENEYLFSAGWGRQIVDKYQVSNLAQFRNIRASKQKAVNTSRCRRLSAYRVSPITLCTMPVMGHMHIDDSGDGLVTKTPVMMLIGVLSFVAQGINMYTRVFLNRPWIMKAVYTLFQQHCPNKEELVDKLFNIE